MVLPHALESQIRRLSRRLDKFVNSSVPEDKKYDNETIESREKKFLRILSDTCTLVREETTNQNPQLQELAEAAQRILDRGIEHAYGDSDMFDFLPSWAHDDTAGQPLVKDVREVKMQIPAGAVSDYIQIFKVSPGSERWNDMVPKPWNENMKRHPTSSPLARPRPNIPALTPTVANPIAMSVYDARCEIKSERICQPIKLRLSRDNACLALNGCGGWKNRAPALCYYLLDESETTTGFQKHHSIEPGLVDVAYHMALDETRRLIFVGDNDRIKSYAWAAPNGERYERTPRPTHTLNCRRESGPITILPNGTIIRAGKGRAAVWNIDSLETHGETGQGIVGKKDESMVEITDRDDPEDIELSTGSSATSHIKFIDNSDLSMARWEPLVQTPSTMICHPDNYQCFTIDLEHGGAITARYLGHGGKVHDLSISGTDPQVFLTACSDGFARLFDLRSPLPVLTFDACGQSEFCDAAILAHPDGIPTVFTGTGKAEQIKVWDVRARTPVYEIATGNNRVQSLAWEPNRHCLYAATECDYQDRHGYRHEYRHSRKWKDEDIDEEDFEIDTPAWPEKAWHDENYFGYAFDAGEHRIYRYAFKEDPDPSIMPEYGDASVNESSRY